MSFGILPAPYVYSMIFELNQEYCKEVAAGCEKRNMAQIVISFASIIGLASLAISIKSRKQENDQIASATQLLE